MFMRPTVSFNLDLPELKSHRRIGSLRRHMAGPGARRSKVSSRGKSLVQFSLTSQLFISCLARSGRCIKVNSDITAQAGRDFGSAECRCGPPSCL